MNCPICHTYNKNAAIFCNDCGFNFKKQKHINSTDINYLKPYTTEFSTDSPCLELSRTYFEVGKRLFERKSNFGELNKIKRKDYLLKARTAFKAMDLQRDLKDLESFTAFNNIDI